MPRGKPQFIIVSAQEFRTLTEATAFIADMLNSLPHATPLPEPHDSFLRDLVSMHPRSAAKANGTITHFCIGPDGFGGRCFHLHRADGSSTDFSYKKCLSGEKYHTAVNGAMRTAVLDQIQAFKEAAFSNGTVICPFTNETLSRENCHVDHVPPRTFYKLVAEWLSREGLTLDDIKISDSIDNQTSRGMMSPVQRSSWAAFHHQNARLRTTSRRGNLSGSKLEARTT